MNDNPQYGQALSRPRPYWFYVIREGPPGPSATYTMALSEKPITEEDPAGELVSVHYPSWGFVFAALILMRQSRSTIEGAEKSLHETGKYILREVTLTDQQLADLLFRGRKTS